MRELLAHPRLSPLVSKVDLGHGLEEIRLENGSRFQFRTRTGHGGRGSETDLLILDEVGVQFGSDTEKLILFDVLNERYEKRRPTLVLSNLSLPDVEQYLGERIFDRLREDGGEAVVFDWESHRGNVQEAA